MPMHMYPSWVIRRDKLTTLALIHQYIGHKSSHKIFKVKVIAPRSKVTGPKFYARAHPPLMGSPQT